VADRDRTGRASAATAPAHRGALARPAGGSWVLRWQVPGKLLSAYAEAAAVVIAALGLRAHRQKLSRMGPPIPVGSDA
jgi:hypothetical protein